MHQLICRLFFSILVSLLFSLSAGAATPMIAAGGNHTCAVSDAGTVQCWGDNNAGQLGNGTMERSANPVTVIGIDNAVSVASGASHTCAVLRGGGVKCWGNTSGSFWKIDSSGNFTLGYDLTPVTVNGITDAIAVGTDYLGNSCVVLASGKVKCWGNMFLGTGDTLFTEIAGINNATTITGGSGYFCTLLRTGEVRCWGRNEYGQLGNGSTVDSIAISVAAQGIQNAISVVATGGNYKTCAVLKTGKVQCWGGYPLNNTTPVNNIPTIVTVGGIGDAIDMAMGNGYTCVLLKNKTVQCWGVNNNGTIGNLSLPNDTTPSLVSGLDNVISLSSGYSHVCALLQTGSIKCWGDNSASQKGNYTIPLTPSSAIPVTVQNINNATSISAGTSSICAALRTGVIQCWGSDFNGGYNKIPTPISSINNATSVSTGYMSACALLQNGEVKCWGKNYNGQLGDGTTMDSAIPVTVKGISDAIAVSTYIVVASPFNSDYDNSFSCATLRSGGVRCWGFNQNIDTILGSSPYLLYINYRTSCQLFDGGKVQCWGNNDYSQLGNGKLDGIASNTPVTVVGINNAIAVSSNGTTRNCALLSTGSIQCWGDDRNGALGAGALGYLAPNFVMGVGGQGYLNLSSPLSQNIDKVLSWAESHFPQFNPSGGISVSDSGYRYRGYQNRYYLGANENGIPHIYYFDAVSMTSFMDVGLLSDFLNLIGN